jgi:hypothetical protein
MPRTSRMSVAIVTALTVGVWQHAQSDGAGTFQQEIFFLREASGGVLVVGAPCGPTPRSLVIATGPAESPESVVRNVAQVINASQWPLCLHGSSVDVAEADGNRLTTRASILFTAGTETGLGIPPPPVFLTADCDVDKGELRLSWENGGKYERVDLWMSAYVLDHVDGGVTSHIFPLERLLTSRAVSSYFEQSGHFLCRLTTTIVAKDRLSNDSFQALSLPSGLAEVEVRPSSMAEVYRSPFTGGVAPNWRSWHDTSQNAPVFRQETRWDPNEGSHRDVRRPQDAPYYQVIEAQKGVVDGGLYRKFLGLTPGKRYKLNMRLQPTREGPGEDALLTVNALCAPSNAGSLTAQQMTAQAVLSAAPGGSQFKQEVPFQRNSSRRWLQLDKLKDVEPDAHTVTMPEGCDTLHVWLRLQSNGAHATVGMDWVELSKVD